VTLCKLTEVAPLVADRVTVFEGICEYVATGSLDNYQGITSESITYTNRPSRADLTVKNNDLCFARMQSTEKVLLITEDNKNFIYSTGFAVIRPNIKSVLPRFLFHLIKSSSFQAKKDLLCSGATQKAITNEKINSIDIFLPTLAEQQRIASILDKAELVKRKRELAINKITNLKQSLFLEMFGDIRLNPKGWDAADLGDLISKASDGPHISPAYSNSGIPFLSTRHIRAGEIIWDDLKYLSIEDAAIQWKKCKPQKGDILYSKGGTTGLAAVVDTDTPFAIWVHVAVLKLRSDLVLPEWLEVALNNEYCYKQSQEFTHGIANKDLGLTRMIKIKIYKPPLSLQKDFVQRIYKLKKLKDACISELNKINLLLSSIQNSTFSSQ